MRGAAIVAVLVLAVVGWLLVKRRGHDGADPAASVLDVIPEGAMLVAVVDVEALRATDVGRNLLGEGRSVAGLGEVATLCGGDPMDAVAELGFAVPGMGADAGFGVFATGAFDAERLLSCASRIVEKRGGRPLRQERDGFAVLRDASMELSSAELAVADGGPLVLAEAAYLRASLEVAAARAPSTRAEAEHRHLRGLLDPGVITATVVLSEEQRRSLVDELRAQKMADSPFAALTSAGLSVQIGEELRLHAVLRCSDAARCAAVAALVDEARHDEAGSVTARVVGLAPVLERMRVAAEGDSVQLRASLPVDDALQLVRRAIALRQLGGSLERSVPEPEPEERPELPPDAGERIPARGGAPP